MECEKGTRTTPCAPEHLGEQIAIALADRDAPSIGHIDLFVTEDCNLACPYCFVKGKTPRSIDLETAFAAIDFGLSRMGKQGQLSVLFFGGEPFLRFDLMKSLTLYGNAAAARMGRSIKFSITTNGTILDEKRLSFCARHGIMILLSLDGGPESHDRHRKFKDGRGSFNVIVRNIPLMKRHQPWLGARVTLSPETVANLCEDIRVLLELGINQFIIGPATGVDWPMEAIDEYTRQMFLLGEACAEWKKDEVPVRISYFEEDEEGKVTRSTWGCGAGKGRISVSVDGVIQGCGKIQGLNQLQGALTFGDVTTGFTIEGLRNRALLNNNTLILRDACRDCDMIDHCAGGCPATNLEFSGSIYLPNPQECEFVRRGQEIKEHYRQLSSGVAYARSSK